MGICSLVFHANRSFFESESEIRSFQSVNRCLCKERREQIALVALFKWATGANVVFYKERFTLLFWTYKGGKHGDKKEKKERIWSKSLLKGVNHSFMKSELLPSLFTYRQHFLPSLFFKEHLERKSKKTKSESTKERFPNPWFYLYCTVRAFRLPRPDETKILIKYFQKIVG